MYSHGQIIDGVLLFQVAVIFSFLISSFVVAGNIYAGFTSILTGLLFAGFCGLTYYGLRRNISRTMFGMILGGTFVLVFVSLESAIFWGQYAHCEQYSGHRFLRSASNPVSRQLSGMACEQRAAMRSVCAFSVFMFLSYLAILGLMMRYKNDILGSGPLNEGYAAVSTSSNTDKDVVE